MPSQIWYPERGDTVFLNDGRLGVVCNEPSNPPIADDEPGVWQVHVGIDGQREYDRLVAYSEPRERWEEVDD